jgi:KDO2-lipid IV(A) lauroyltransferase
MVLATVRDGRFYGRMLDQLVPRLRRVARENLSFALPELSTAARERLIDGVFESVGRVVAGFARFPRINRANVDDWIRVEGAEHVENALARGRGVIFATGHLGNWELSAFAFALLSRPIHVVVRPLDNPLMDVLVERYRGLSGNQLIGKRDYVRGILEALRRNEMVGILADQHTQDGVWVDFFGRLAAATPGIARIAAKTGAAIVPGFALWSEEERKYVLRFYPEVPPGTAQVQKAIEAVIREYPGQWLWIHRRWKG